MACFDISQGRSQVKPSHTVPVLSGGNDGSSKCMPFYLLTFLQISSLLVLGGLEFYFVLITFLFLRSWLVKIESPIQ